MGSNDDCLAGVCDTCQVGCLCLCECGEFDAYYEDEYDYDYDEFGYDYEDGYDVEPTY